MVSQSASGIALLTATPPPRTLALWTVYSIARHALPTAALRPMTAGRLLSLVGLCSRRVYARRRLPNLNLVPVATRDITT